MLTPSFGGTSVVAVARGTSWSSAGRGRTTPVATPSFGRTSDPMATIPLGPVPVVVASLVP
jgi:hypothetical protein